MYLTTILKPVKVISSMGELVSVDHGLSMLIVTLGEQSVGKSYALNHMVDTSFAGSAMRTTGKRIYLLSLILT